MSDASVVGRRLLARIAFAFVITWLGILLVLVIFHPMLILISMPVLTLVMLHWIAEDLVLLSIVVVPLSVLIKARLCLRGSLGFAPHCATGAAIAAGSMLLMFLAERLLGMDLGSLPNVGMPWLFVLLVAGLIGAVSSAVVWFFVIRPLRSHQKDVVGAFE